MNSVRIGGREIPLRFGLAFIRELDKKFERKTPDGLVYGQGLSYTYLSMHSGDVLVLSDVIQAATCTEEIPPTQDEIDTYLEAEDTDLEALRERFLSLYETSKLMKNEITPVAEALGRLEPPKTTSAGSRQKRPTKTS
ncbi:MAG: tail assembly chaperone [Bacillota bacterium]|nr:tail assembly chaperone [Bacillota bacterium]